MLLLLLLLLFVIIINNLDVEGIQTTLFDAPDLINS